MPDDIEWLPRGSHAHAAARLNLSLRLLAAALYRAAASDGRRLAAAVARLQRRFRR